MKNERIYGDSFLSYVPCFAEAVQAANMARASAEATSPLGERNALLMRSVKSAFALLLTKVTKPAAERRKAS